MPAGLTNAIAGLINFQKMIDIVGNNLSNLNTPGYKSSNITFKELMAQTIRGGSAPTSSRGGTNPMQIGLGTTLADIGINNIQGALEVTGKPTNLAITGGGLFILKSGDSVRYSRNGNFNLDQAGNLVDTNGLNVQGWMADATGVIDSTGGASTMTSLNIPLGEEIVASPTTWVKFTGNLDASQAIVDPFTPPIPAAQHTIRVTTYDSMGGSTEVTLDFWKVNPAAIVPAPVPVPAAAWYYSASGPAGGPVVTGSGYVGYNSSGQYEGLYNTADITYTPLNGATQVTIAPDYSSTSQLDRDTSTLVPQTQDGTKAGSLETFTIDSNGFIIGNFTNGTTKEIGQVALASFTNVGGLVKVESGNYIESANSGIPSVGAPNTGARGAITSNSIEQSNVDLGAEFTRMIIAQRAFQANSRLISTYDDMLNEAANMKR